MNTLLQCCVCCLVLAVATWLGVDPPVPPRRETAAPPTAAVAPAAPVAAAVRTTADPVVASPASGPLLHLPDGSTVAALNDVTAVAPMAWGDRPWSPIVGRERHDGIEWYHHADGSFSTTRMLWRSDLGRDDPATLCVHPVAPTRTAGDRRRRVAGEPVLVH